MVPHFWHEWFRRHACRACDYSHVCKGGDKHFTEREGGGQTFSVVADGGHDDVDNEKEEDVSEANTLASKASKLSAGAGILRGP